MTWKCYMQTFSRYLEKSKNVVFRVYEQDLMTYGQNKL